MTDIFPEILNAEKRISKYILRTPLIKSLYLSKLVGGNIFLKLESEQITGSFKARGAFNKILWLKENYSDKKVVTASTGNHALGVANALKMSQMQGKIVIPENIVNSKYEALKLYDIELIKHGKDCLDAENFAKKLSENENYEYISPYNDIQIIAGQGTCGIEILTQTTDNIDNIFVTVGGGGLISGIGTYAKKINPRIKIFGCQPENSPEMTLSIRNNKYTTVENRPTLSDGSAGAFDEKSITYDICKQVVDDFFLISENDIAKTMNLIYKKERKFIEGSASVAIASLINNYQRFKNQNSIIVICGGNVSHLDVFN
jgi:threonine dehydratase